MTCCHNKIRDAREDLASKLWQDVKQELIIKNADGERGTLALVANFLVVWSRQSSASFVFGVTDIEFLSHLIRNPMSILNSAEEKRKKIYQLVKAYFIYFTSEICSANEFIFFSSKLNMDWVQRRADLASRLCFVLREFFLPFWDQSTYARFKERSLGLDVDSTIGRAI